MRISPRILTTALLAFCAFAFAGAQSTNDLPKLSEIKGKKLILNSKKLSLEPFFSKLLTNNYPEGISEISFFIVILRL